MEDRDHLLAFRREAYGPASFQADPRHLRWRPDVWIYRSGEVAGQIAGQVAAHAVQVRIAARERAGVWLSDIFVHPRARGQGIGTTLIETAATAAPLAMLIEVTDEARGILRRAGWMDIGDVPLYVRPLHPAFLQMRFPGPTRSVARPAAAALRALEACWAGALRAAGLQLCEVPRFDDRSDTIWNAVGHAYDVIARRDRDALEQRFCAFPLPDRYRLYYFMQRRHPVGYAVVRTEPRAGLRVGHLVDFLCAPSHAPLLLAAAAAVLRRQEVHVVHCLCRSPLPAATFAAAGFLRRRSSWPLLVDVRRLPPGEQVVAGDARRWFVTAGDSTVDRPRDNTVYARPEETGARPSHPPAR